MAKRYMAKRYVWNKRRGKYIDTYKRRALRLLARIAGEVDPICVSGKYPSAFNDDRPAWLDFRRAEAYRWLLRGSFIIYRYY